MELRDQLQATIGGSYTIERELTGGGMSRVFAATETALGRTVVIKVLPSDMAGQVSMDRFKREIMLAARLQHAHIVPLLNAGESDGLPYFTMPFIDGESLRVRIARHGELPLNEAMRMLREVASALAYAHERGIVHRDIKPDNVLLSGGAAMVTDFGVAKALSASSNAEDGKVTSLGVALGTPAYMAPEQATADPTIDHRADIYAFGALAYEVLTGQPPFVGRSPQGLLTAHITEAPELIAKRRPNIPPALAALVMRCLEKRAADRPQSASEIVHILDDITTPSGGTAPLSAVMVPAQPSTAALPWKWIGVAAVAIAVVVAAATFRAKSAATPTVTSVAVFPFENASGDTAMAYFADGMTDQLAAALGDAGLRVIGRASVLSVQEKHLSDQEAGRALGASMILHGRVARAADRLRVWTQLTNAADGAAIATKTYDTTMTNVFGVQDGLARAIAAALRPSVASPAVATSARSARGTDDLQAYDAYLKGNYYADRSRPDRAVVAYGEAIARDPKFAQATAMLSIAYARLASTGTGGSESTYARARELARQALALDSLLPSAHSAWGQSLANDLRFAESLPEFQRASDLAPDNPNHLLAYGDALESVGRMSEGLEAVRHAMQLDPLSVRAAVLAQYAYYMVGRYDAGLDATRRALELDSTSAITWSNRAVIYSALHKPDSALAAYKRWYSFGNRFGAAPFLVLGYALTEHWPEARALADSLQENPRDNSPNFTRMLVGLAFARWNDAMTALETGFDRREPVFATLKVTCDPMFDVLKTNPRFDQLMARYKLTPCPARNVWPLAKPPR
jgi:serine/threonine-protein kinase